MIAPRWCNRGPVNEPLKTEDTVHSPKMLTLSRDDCRKVDVAADAVLRRWRHSVSDIGMYRQ